MNESSESESSGCESSTSERKNTEGPMSMDEGYVSKDLRITFELIVIWRTFSGYHFHGFLLLSNFSRRNPPRPNEIAAQTLLEDIVKG